MQATSNPREIMTDYFSRKFRMPFEEAVQKLTRTLQQHHFGVITAIDVKDTLRQKLGIPFRRYKILAAFNHELAYKAITLESHLGVMLQCNLVVQEHENGEVEVSAINPLHDNHHLTSTPQLRSIAMELTNLLRAAVDAIPRNEREPARRAALPDRGGRRFSTLSVG